MIKRGTTVMNCSDGQQLESVGRIADWDKQVVQWSAADIVADGEIVPDAPGIYIFRDSTGYLYIGEASSLKHRVNQHLDHSDRKSLACTTKSGRSRVGGCREEPDAGTIGVPAWTGRTAVDPGGFHRVRRRPRRRGCHEPSRPSISDPRSRAKRWQSSCAVFSAAASDRAIRSLRSNCARILATLPRMRIAILGSGAVGGYFGGRLAQAGAEVAFIARGEQLAALQSRGLQIHSPLGDTHIRDIHATNDPESVGPVDVVLFSGEAVRHRLGAWPAAAASRPADTRHPAAEWRGRRGRAYARRRTHTRRRRHDLCRRRRQRAWRHPAHRHGPADCRPGQLHPGPSLRAASKSFTPSAHRAGFDIVLSDWIIVDIWAKFVPPRSSAR